MTQIVQKIMHAKTIPLPTNGSVCLVAKNQPIRKFPEIKYMEISHLLLVSDKKILSGIFRILFLLANMTFLAKCKHGYSFPNEVHGEKIEVYCNLLGSDPVWQEEETNQPLSECTPIKEPCSTTDLMTIPNGGFQKYFVEKQLFVNFTCHSDSILTYQKRPIHLFMEGLMMNASQSELKVQSKS